MPELPEVENFRQLLLPLVSDCHFIHLERCNLEKTPPRKFVSDEDIAKINRSKYQLSDVKRKGKQLVMILKSSPSHTKNNSSTKENKKNYSYYVFLTVHMGMTGRISTPEHVPQLESQTSNEYPPPHTYLKFTCHDKEACFSDPRKFGSIQLLEAIQNENEIENDNSDSNISLEQQCLGSLAPDALTDAIAQDTKPHVIDKLSNQSLGVKALLLDQKRAVSGVGNWVADEVLYQLGMHPDQNFLTNEQAARLLETLHALLKTAVDCLSRREGFPQEWLFHFRWNNKKPTKDFKGRAVTFVTSGGRTSAIVPSLQKKNAQTRANKTIARSTRALDDEKKESGTSSKKRQTTVKKEASVKSTQSSTTKKRKSQQKPSELNGAGETSTKATKKGAKASDGSKPGKSSAVAKQSSKKSGANAPDARDRRRSTRLSSSSR